MDIISHTALSQDEDTKPSPRQNRKPAVVNLLRMRTDLRISFILILFILASQSAKEIAARQRARAAIQRELANTMNQLIMVVRFYFRGLVAEITRLNV